MSRVDLDAIQYFDRHRGRMETESVYGGHWLRWVYGTLPGRLAGRLVARRIWFSRWYGWRMNRPASRALIRPFIDSFHIDVSELAQPPEAYPSFDAFFSRPLRPGARPIDPGVDTIVFPADGRHLGFADLSAAASFFVKGQRFDL
ncbi:MAG: phosphatidylserine decarboxylase, partial [Verrucomicrobiales bacterium]|nr:phosphatidylserine decarboxylase [Verrucomicrobiales bacterium]